MATAVGGRVCATQGPTVPTAPQSHPAQTPWGPDPARPAHPAQRAAPRGPHPAPRAPLRPSSLPRGRHPSPRRAPSLPSPSGSSALLPGFASFAFPRLPAPRQSDLRTQRRQRLPLRREPPPPPARPGRGEGREPGRPGGAGAGQRVPQSRVRLAGLGAAGKAWCGGARRDSGGI